MKKYFHIAVVTLLVLSCKKNNDDTPLPSAELQNVSIGTQVWAIKNLDITTYRNGDPIPQVADARQWAALTTGAWCYFNNDPANNEKYGKLYNAYALADTRCFAPQGWHVPTSAEWSTLTSYLGGVNVAGGKMKAVSSLWQSPNTGATNTSGFLGLPGGARSTDGNFSSQEGVIAIFWSPLVSTGTADETLGPVWSLDYNTSKVNGVGHTKRYGHSVRCLKD